MILHNEAWVVIPARGGSKGIPKKNLIGLNSHPLIAYTIIAALESRIIKRVIVSTDSEEILTISEKYGAEIPFIRPPEISGDKSGDLDFVLHFFKWFEDNEGALPKYLINLRPTTPLRDPLVIDQAINSLITNNKATSLRSVHELPEPPQKMMKFEQGYLTGFFPDDPRQEYYNLPRQEFPKAYHPNGYIDVYKTEHVLEKKALYGQKVLGFITDYTEELDNIQNFRNIENYLKIYSHPLVTYLNKIRI